MMNTYHDNSFWFDILEEDLVPREPLTTDIKVDIAIVGAGYTGLWLAYYLKIHSPNLSIAILEAETAGFGASGRNGGWVHSHISGMENYLSNLSIEEKKSCCQTLFDNVDIIDKVLSKEKIDADFNKGGVIYAAARYPEQERIQQKILKKLYRIGHTEDDCQWLSKSELYNIVRMRNSYGAIYTPHCATINPAKMVRQLAKVVEGLGVKIYEKSRVKSIFNRKLKTELCTVMADTIVPAMEGYTDTIGQFAKSVIPVQSLIIATEPLSKSLWEQIGLSSRPAFSDGSRMVSYGQRTVDNRMIFGARGGYLYGGKYPSQFSLENHEFRSRENLLTD